MRRLAVTYKVSNAGPDANGVMISVASNSAGVTMFTQILGVDNLADGANTPLTLLYNVPLSVSAFTTSISASADDACGNHFNYP